MPRFLPIGTIALIGSLAAKWLADAFLIHRIAIIGSFVGLQPSTNPGIAFGLQLPTGLQQLFILLALIIVFIVALKSARSTISHIGFGLIIGGALANVVDRIFDGLVTDFFQVGTFPIFNVADSCITIGVCFLLAETFILNRRISR